MAGVAGALAASEMGLKPIVLEKADKLGGITTNSYGLVWIGQNHLARAAGIEDKRDDVIAYMRFLGGGAHVEEKMLAYVDHGPTALKFFEDCGIPFRMVRGITDHYYGKAPGALVEGRSLEVELISGFELGEWKDRILAPHDVPCFVTAEEQVSWGGLNRFSQWDADLVRERKRKDMRGKGLGLISHFVKALVARGVPIETNQTVERLIMDGPRVAGVQLTSGERILARAGVIVATGGYHANPEMAQQLEGMPGMVQEPSSLAPASATGDGLVLAGEIGAIIHKVENALKVQLAYTIPAQTPGELPLCVHAGIVELCSPHTLVVNRYGQRFADETFFQGIVPHLRHFDAAKHEYPNIPAYLIFDQSYLAQYSFANAPIGTPVPSSVARADSLAALAGLLGIDGAALESTVARYNGFVASGRDEDYRRGEHKWRLAGGKNPTGNPTMGTLAKPPFFGVPLHPTISNAAGLLTNENGQVLHQRRRPIPGLYASGYAASPVESGVGYQAGILLASSMTFGYLATQHMRAQLRAAA
jgi:3-oxosteroid 1-dehydrogenase